MDKKKGTIGCMKKICCSIYLSGTSLILMLMLACSSVYAASVRQVSMDQMLTTCQFVFQGRVTAIEARQNEGRRIHSYVTFAIEEVIKGQYSGDQITLSFLGGTVGGITMAVSDMQLPRVGERGVYFVESLERSQVNPLYGWSQGHFLVERDEAGDDRVMTSGKQPVLEVTGDNAGVQISPGERRAPALSKGVASGVGVSGKSGVRKGMVLSDFKKALRGRLETVQ